DSRGGFGYLVRGLGDLNADGAPEVAVVAPHRTTASSSLYHVEVDIISPAAAGDDRVRLKLADGEQCVIDVNVVGLNGVNYIDVVTMTVTAVYTHNLFDLSGVKIETEADTDVYRYGDVNKDNKIDQEDLWLVLNNMNTQAESGSPFQIDVNKDGLINESDLNDVVSASTNTPILKELSFFAQNRLQEMGEQFPVYFGITPETLQTVAEQRVNEKKDECKQCAQGQKKGCDDKCCGPGNWVWTRGVPTTTQTATVTGYNVTATSTTLSVPNAQNCQGSITLNDVMPSWTGLTINTSSTGAGTVAWNVTDTENWVGSGPACKRLVGAVISGTGALGVSLSTDPYPGNSASGSASGSSTGTGLGGSAAMPMTPISGSVSISQVAGSSALTLSLSASPSVSTAIPPGGGTPGNGQMGGSIGVTASAANNSTVTGTATLAVSGSFTVVGRYPADGTQICTDSAITDTNVGSLQCNDAAVGYQTGLSYGYKYARALVTASANMMITP
ncbi:MAG: hypothetical protein K2X42_02520, partial [Burkholderiaceae bacterium]|nr:hypothetical protein [Burkholderiaceae bacterium]